MVGLCQKFDVSSNQTILHQPTGIMAEAKVVGYGIRIISLYNTTNNTGPEDLEILMVLPVISTSIVKILFFSTITARIPKEVS